MRGPGTWASRARAAPPTRDGGQQQEDERPREVQPAISRASAWRDGKARPCRRPGRRRNSTARAGQQRSPRQAAREPGLRSPPAAAPPRAPHRLGLARRASGASATAGAGAAATVGLPAAGPGPRAARRPPPGAAPRRAARQAPPARPRAALRSGASAGRGAGRPVSGSTLATVRDATALRANRRSVGARPPQRRQRTVTAPASRRPRGSGRAARGRARGHRVAQRRQRGVARERSRATRIRPAPPRSRRSRRYRHRRPGGRHAQPSSCSATRNASSAIIATTAAHARRSRAATARVGTLSRGRCDPHRPATGGRALLQHALGGDTDAIVVAWCPNRAGCGGRLGILQLQPAASGKTRSRGFRPR